ncbi:hypothetical protein ES707_20569 [subsurface metagenome]
MSRDNSHGESVTPNKHVVVQNHVRLVGSVSIKTRYEVSIWAYNFAKHLVEECHRYRGFCEKANEIQDKLGHQLNEMQNSMGCFVFCAICLEAYINTYAGDRLSKLIWEKLERLPHANKWIIVPELLLKKTFESDKKPYTLLKWLVEKRNSIVHHKGKFSEPRIDRLGVSHDRVFAEFTLEEAEKAFQLVKDLIKSLHSFDASKAPDWVV